VIRALWRIAPAEREVIALHYVEGLSHREIAALLGLPVTTVNNRMHTGRRNLRRALAGVAGRALRQARLPATFTECVVRMLRVRGPVVDLQFEAVDLPQVLETIVLHEEPQKREVLLEVVQRRGQDTVRCIVVSRESNKAIGGAAAGESRAAGEPVANVRDAIGALHQRRRRRLTFLETGIKAVDLLCPVVAGGSVAIAGDAGAGKLVLVQELARRLANLRGGVGVFAFVRIAEKPWARSVAGAMEVLAMPPDLTFVLQPENEDHNDLDELPVDTLIVVSRTQAEHRIYPAIDPLRSRSTFLTSTTATRSATARARVVHRIPTGRSHAAIASAVRDAIGRLGGDTSLEQIAKSDDSQTRRALMLQLYMSQPFFTAQPFTGVAGEWVSRRDTLRMCREILNGRHDAAAPAAFWFIGARQPAGLQQ
jgi:F0F1-type ATP synthase beta subunit